jgi:hypothetical protein
MIGFSVQPIERRVSPEFVRKFRSLPVANVSDCMSRSEEHTSELQSQNEFT